MMANGSRNWLQDWTWLLWHCAQSLQRPKGLQEQINKCRKSVFGLEWCGVNSGLTILYSSGSRSPERGISATARSLTGSHLTLRLSVSPSASVSVSLVSLTSLWSGPARPAPPPQVLISQRDRSSWTGSSARRSAARRRLIVQRPTEPCDGSFIKARRGTPEPPVNTHHSSQCLIACTERQFATASLFTLSLINALFCVM